MASSSPAVELPTFKGRPGWEFTDITGLDLAAYEPADGDEAATATPLFDLPQAPELPDGVIVTSIDAAMRDHAELVERHLGSLVSADDPFVMLNDAGYRNGSFVYVPRGVAVDQPISLASVQARTGTLFNQRTLIVLDEGAQAEVWEQYLSASDDLDGVFNDGDRADRRRQRAPALRLRPGPVRAQLDLRCPARRGRSRRVA